MIKHDTKLHQISDFTFCQFYLIFIFYLSYFSLVFLLSLSGFYHWGKEPTYLFAFASVWCLDMTPLYMDFKLFRICIDQFTQLTLQEVELGHQRTLNVHGYLWICHVRSHPWNKIITSSSHIERLWIPSTASRQQQCDMFLTSVWKRLHVHASQN